MSIVLSQEQELFIEKALEGNNILVDACIGSGKTTSIQHLCQRFPSSKSILYLTYNKLLKIDAKSKIKGKNITVTNYHGFALMVLKRAGISCGISDLIQTFNKEKPSIPYYDVLIIDEYQDIDQELSELLEIIKASNLTMQIIAVGDMEQKIYDRTTLNVLEFINQFLDKHICMDFTQCFRLNSTYAAKLGRIWSKNIIGVNESCKISEMTTSEAISFISNQRPKDILCLGARTRKMSVVLNELETNYPDIFNKKTVYASIMDNDNGRAVEPNNDAAIFTTYDSSKGLERKICIIFDFSEGYWDIRAKKPQQSYEILRNIFCVAASRGKDHIIFVKDDEELLSERTLATPVTSQEKLKLVGFSDMFDFKYKESVEKCFSLLAINKIPMEDAKQIDIKTHDDLIDLSPCIGIYQEASFFINNIIDKDIELYLKLQNKEFLFTDEIKSSSLARKVLFFTAMETNQMRYYYQVDLPFITKEEEMSLHKRLSCLFSPNDNAQVLCSFDFDCIPEKTFSAKGYADVVKDGIVYELKFVSELSHEHFLQCACYAVALNLKKGILWNTRTNEMYEISVPNVKDFCLEVAKAVLKIPPEENQSTISQQRSHSIDSIVDSVYKNITEQNDDTTSILAKDCFAVIDTETNWSNKVMSIGMCIVEKGSYRCIEQKYYIINPEATEPGIYSNQLRIKNCPAPIECSRNEALKDIKTLIEKCSITDAFAYNASFDSNHLPEMNYVSWYDIMKIAAYKQFNPYIPFDAECCSTGKLKRNYGVEHMIHMLTGNNGYFESHNAACDAYDEALIMKMLSVPYQVYKQNALVRAATTDRISIDRQEPIDTPLFRANSESYRAVQSEHDIIPDKDETHFNSQERHGDDTLSAEEVAELLGISKSTVYKYIKNGAISARKVGNKYYISKQSVFSYLRHMAEIRKIQRKALIAVAIGFGVLLVIVILICIFLL